MNCVFLLATATYFLSSSRGITYTTHGDNNRHSNYTQAKDLLDTTLQHLRPLLRVLVERRRRSRRRRTIPPTKPIEYRHCRCVELCKAAIQSRSNVQSRKESSATEDLQLHIKHRPHVRYSFHIHPSMPSYLQGSP